MGVSLVRRMGSSLSYVGAFAGGLRFCQRTASADVAESVRPSKWTDSRVRMEFWGRQSACSCLGHIVPVLDGATTGQSGPALPGTVLSGIDVEFQLVGQPQGSARQECFRWRIPRTGQ